ncbi:MAG: efflux RND transporter permease subunit [Candidatus Delongbacteria bacterium]|nr:efflux RND transporter permease subunit [Candidatus Delongbacteria bacterium]MBN2834769.1 efflux RND transporter permease subunit [Candidatus Delongbacteria bacterium]
MGLLKLFIERPVLTWVFVLALVLTGGMSYFGMPLNTMPETDIPIIAIQVVYPGAGPEEIESNITKRIEDEVSTVPNLDYVQSTVMENVSISVCRFKMGKDVDIANQEVKDKVSSVKGFFPTDAEEPIISKFDPASEPVVYISFLSKLTGVEAYEFADKELKKRFSKLNGVSKVEITGGQSRQIDVVLEKDKLKKYSLSPLQVLAFIQKSNMNLPSGSIKNNGNEYNIKVEGEFEALSDLADLRIPVDKNFVKLSEISRVVDSSEKMKKSAGFWIEGNDGTNYTVINLAIKKQSDANTVKVVENVISQLDEIKTILPSDATLKVAKDESTFIKNSVNDTNDSIILGVILTSIILFIFLRKFSTTFIAAIIMPIVIISTFLLMKGSGFSLNFMSLMAISVSVGTLVTNAVVILENIDRYIKLGFNPKEAALKGTGEIAVAVAASTLTNVVVFVPIGTMSSLVGQFFKEFGLTVAYIMLFSIFFSFTLTPMLSAVLLRKEVEGKPKPLLDRLIDKLASGYRKLLDKMIGSFFKRSLIIVISMSILIFSMISIGGKLGGEFLPFVDDGDVTVSIEMPTYYNIEKTINVFKEVESRILKLDDIEKVITNVGVLGQDEAVNIGNIQIKLKEDRKISSKKFEALLSEKLANIPDATLKVSATSSVGASGGSAVQLEVIGFDEGVITDLTKQLYDIVKETEGTINADTDLRDGKPEIKLVPKRDLMNQYELTVYDLAMTMRAYIEGLTSSKFKEMGEEFDIVLKLDDKNINDLEKISNLEVATSKGFRKISELADITFETAPTKISRKDKQKKHLVTSDVSGKTSGEILNSVMARVNSEMSIPEGYRIGTAGDLQMMKEAIPDFAMAASLAIALTFLLIAALLESFSQSFLIMMTVPLSLIGVLWSLFLGNESLNIMSMMAGVMLIGIVVNNAIIIVDYANQLWKNGQNKYEAVLEACEVKLKAIIMATLASILGMLPLALGLGKGAELRQGMGLVSIGGLLVSSLLTLFVIPALYTLFTKKKNIKEVK